MQIVPFFLNLRILLSSEIVIFLSLIESSFFVLHVVHYFIASIIILNTF